MQSHFSVSTPPCTIIQDGAYAISLRAMMSAQSHLEFLWVNSISTAAAYFIFHAVSNKRETVKLQVHNKYKDNLNSSEVISIYTVCLPY